MVRYTNVPFQAFRGELDRLFDDFLGTTPGRIASSLYSKVAYPSLNVWEDRGSYFVEAECPGLDLEDIEISIIKNQLILSAKPENVQDDQLTWHRRERVNGEFRRALALPCEVDAGKASASLKNGVLLIELPKAESAIPRKISINAGS